MTQAICFRCGETKSGGFVPCPICQVRPVTDDEIAKSLMLTDHYFDAATLDEMSRRLQSGLPIDIDSESRDQLLSQLPKRMLLWLKAKGGPDDPGEPPEIEKEIDIKSDEDSSRSDDEPGNGCLIFLGILVVKIVVISGIKWLAR